jgi:hypothetical protein
MSWIKNLKLGPIFTSILIGTLTLELFSFFLTRSSLLLVNETPKLYQQFIVAGASNVSTNWYTEQELWGAWHKNNSIAQHNKICFSAEYKSNSVGARDDEFINLKKENTYVLLGDSFAEGFGVNFNETAHRIIEKNTEKNLLNFGTSGSFGPLQYWLIYNSLAKPYPHNGLIIFFLPANDFTDNDYEYWTNNNLTYFTTNQERYRPYYRQLDDNTFGYFIPPNAVKGDDLRAFDTATSSKLKQFLIDNFWSSNVLRTTKLLLFSAELKKAGKGEGRGVVTQMYSGYFDPTDTQQKAAVYFIKKIVLESLAEKILIVSIPTQEDFDRVARGQKRESMTWWKTFKDLELERRSVRFLDLLDHPSDDVKSLFFSCDGHWSPEGNKWAADIISKSMLD